MNKRTDKEIVARYIRGEYASICDYAKDFSKAHETINWYDMAFGKKRKHRKPRLEVAL